jgi:hypothetical protein
MGGTYRDEAVPVRDERAVALAHAPLRSSRVRRRDLNGDGRPDVVVSRGEAGPFVSVLLNRGDGTLGAKRDYRGAGRFAKALAAADVNGHRQPDLVVADGAQGHGISVFAIAAGDLNGDGRDDLLAQTVYGSPHAPLPVLLNPG